MAKMVARLSGVYLEAGGGLGCGLGPGCRESMGCELQKTGDSKSVCRRPSHELFLLMLPHLVFQPSEFNWNHKCMSFTTSKGQEVQSTTS